MITGEGFLVFLFGMAVAFLICASLSWDEVDYKTPAIEAGCAQYNPQTGEFEWLNKK
jgi:hypothetical protein